MKMRKRGVLVRDVRRSGRESKRTRLIKQRNIEVRVKIGPLDRIFFISNFISMDGLLNSLIYVILNRNTQINRIMTFILVNNY